MKSSEPVETIGAQIAPVYSARRRDCYVGVSFNAGDGFSESKCSVRAPPNRLRSPNPFVLV
ncbi:hypothetical protein K3495_g4574 [Podosphaera aphanis]|nr:hypothetical protein K3495_g4574 [Podosphaera aphanis]